MKRRILLDLSLDSQIFGEIGTLGLLGTSAEVIHVQNPVIVEGRNLSKSFTLYTHIKNWQGFLLIEKEESCYISHWIL